MTKESISEFQSLHEEDVKKVFIEITSSMTNRSLEVMLEILFKKLKDSDITLTKLEEEYERGHEKGVEEGMSRSEYSYNEGYDEGYDEGCKEIRRLHDER